MNISKDSVKISGPRREQHFYKKILKHTPSRLQPEAHPKMTKLHTTYELLFWSEVTGVAPARQFHWVWPKWALYSDPPTVAVLSLGSVSKIPHNSFLQNLGGGCWLRAHSHAGCSSCDTGAISWGGSGIQEAESRCEVALVGLLL